MEQDLQQLLEKINKDGVEKAKGEAAKIASDAQAKADAIIAAAKAQAAQTAENAKRDAAAFESRAEETIRQAARDTVLKVEQSVTAMLTALLVKDANAAMRDPNLVPKLAAQAVAAYISGKGGIELAAGKELADLFRSKLAAEAAKGVRIVTDENTGSGFRIRLANGRIEHDFTGNAVAEALAKSLRPRLAALVRPQEQGKK